MEPSCLDVTTRRWMLSVPTGTDPSCPAGGWISYVRSDGKFQSDLPAGVTTEAIGHGVLMVGTTEDFLDSNPCHAEVAHALNKALAGIREAENDLNPGRSPAYG